MTKAIAILITLISLYQMYITWDTAPFEGWFIGFIGWINVFFYELDKEKNVP